MLTATYSPDDNKLRLYSLSRLDPDTYTRVKAAGFKWAPKQDLFVAPMWTPDREDLLLELCGDIGDEDTSLVERAEERSERFETYRDKRAADATSAQQSVAAIADGIPFGQPILVGHHSERHARKDAERIENGMRRVVRMWETSKYWQGRAAGALRHAKYKELPTVRARRIKTIEADRRRCERNHTAAADMIRLWGKLNVPSSQDGRPADDDLRQKRALAIANVHNVHLRSGDPRGWSIWSALEDGKMTPREAQLTCLKHAARCIKINRRWIAHFDHRLTYERAMLAEQGASNLLDKKPKSAKAQLPLCNYRAPNGLDIQNMYNRGEMIHYPQIEMSQAEYAKIYADYKGTRVVSNSHRVRTTMQRHSLVCVFLTDSKVHAIPEPREAPVRTPPIARPRVLDSDVSKPTEPAIPQETIDAMKSALKTGVQVVSAPQLFPTPPEVARQAVELVGLAATEDGQLHVDVLEPSAGLGNLVDAIRNPNARIVAVERSSALCNRLRTKHEIATVIEGDFLEQTPEAIGRFDYVVMNPPFINGSDIKHVQHARSFLKPGGRLVAICANGPRQRETLQPIAYDWLDLPDGTFKEQGTSVRTAIVLMEEAS